MNSSVASAEDGGGSIAAKSASPLAVTTTNAVSPEQNAAHGGKSPASVDQRGLGARMAQSHLTSGRDADALRCKAVLPGVALKTLAKTGSKEYEE